MISTHSARCGECVDTTCAVSAPTVADSIKPPGVNDIDKVAQAICQVIAHSGTVVKALDKRNGHRKVASRLFLAGKLLPQAAAALRDQYKMWEGLSGPRPAAPAGPAGQA